MLIKIELFEIPTKLRSFCIWLIIYLFIVFFKNIFHKTNSLRREEITLFFNVNKILNFVLRPVENSQKVRN